MPPEPAPGTVPAEQGRHGVLTPTSLPPAAVTPASPAPWSALPALSTVAARAFGHRARHRHAAGRLRRGVQHLQDAVQLVLGLALYPVILAGFRASPWTEVYAAADRRAVLNVVHRRARTGRRRRRPAQWTVYDVAAWPYGTGAGRRLLQSVQATAAASGATLRLKATDTLVDRVYGPLGFTAAGRRHWYAWTPPNGDVPSAGNQRENLR